MSIILVPQMLVLVSFFCNYKNLTKEVVWKQLILPLFLVCLYSHALADQRANLVLESIKDNQLVTTTGYPAVFSDGVASA